MANKGRIFTEIVTTCETEEFFSELRFSRAGFGLATKWKQDQVWQPVLKGRRLPLTYAQWYFLQRIDFLCFKFDACHRLPPPERGPVDQRPRGLGPTRCRCFRTDICRHEQRC